MFCKKCGTKINETQKFCGNCGEKISIQDDLTAKKEEVKKKSKGTKILKGLGSVIVVFVIILVFLSRCSDEGQDSTVNLEETTIDYAGYTNYEEGNLPVAVKSISYQDSFYVGFTDIDYTVENLTDVPYKEVEFAVLAWDKDGFPLKINESDYTTYFCIDNVRANETGDYRHQVAQILDIGYMSFFVANCTDFDGNTWINPIIDSIDDIEGNLLEDSPLSYYMFE